MNMELDTGLLDEKQKERLKVQKETFQYNKQDLDQEQKVDVNPVQLNTQNLHIHMINDNKYSGKITGTTFADNSREIVRNASIVLFFGGESKLPVHKTNSDNNGNFVIEDLPPGYYTIFAEHRGKLLYYRSHFIKVLPGQIINLSILLR